MVWLQKARVGQHLDFVEMKRTNKVDHEGVVRDVQGRPEDQRNDMWDTGKLKG